MTRYVPSKFGELLRRYRVAAGFSQEALADRAGLSAHGISDLERGARTRPHPSTVRRLADALGLGEATHALLSGMPSDADHQVAEVNTTHATPASREQHVQFGESRAEPRQSSHAQAQHPPQAGSSGSGMVKRDGNPSGLPAASSEADGESAAAATELPPVATPLLGREVEIGAALDLLCSEDVRLLTLTGAGGSGKTRLALRIAEIARTFIGYEVFFVDLAVLSQPSQVMPAIIHAIGGRNGDERSSLARLELHLRDRRVLLVLDNFEHLLPAASDVASVLNACPDVKVLATTREPLRVTWEHEFPVPPLAVPQAFTQVSVAQVKDIPSVQLFVTRARAVDPSFELTEGNAEPVAEICVRLDGLPLAIELAAARVKLFPPQALAARLDRRLSILKGGPRDTPARQRALRATIDWSYNLLNPDERRLFRTMAIFVGGFTLEAANAVWCKNSQGEAEHELLDLISSLVDKNLLHRYAASTCEPRVGMLETLREYSLEALAAARELPQVGEAHAAEYLAFAERTELDLEGAGAPAALLQLDVEYGNLRSALAWYLCTADADPALRLATALVRFWKTRGYLVEGLSYLRRALELSTAATATAVRARALLRAGELIRVYGDFSQSTTYLSEALDWYRRMGDRSRVAECLHELAGSLRYQLSFGAARVHQTEALELAREIGDPALLQLCLVGMGALETDEGNLEAGRELLLEALDLATERRDPVGLVQTHTFLGVIEVRGNRYAGAQVHLRQALEANNQLQHLYYYATIFEAMASLAGARGQFQRALTLVGASSRLLEAVGSRDSLARQGWREWWFERAGGALGPEKIDVLLADGWGMSLERALQCALRDDEEQAA